MRLGLLALSVLAVLAPAAPAFADRLDTVKARGAVLCGVSGSLAGFSKQGTDGNWAGLEVDYCRALAAAIFNDPGAVRFIPEADGQRWTDLKSGAIDVLARASTWTMERDADVGVAFVGTLFYDGQSFLVRKQSNLGTAHDLSGQPVCVEANTSAALNAEDYFATNRLTYDPVTLEGHDAGFAAFVAGKCVAYTADASRLAADRSTLSNAADYVFLPEVISNEPLALSVALGDDRWFKIARWVYFAMLDADELGVTQKNIDEMVGSDSAEVKRLLGLGEEDFGSSIGLSKDWVYRIVKAVGNYGESFDRNVGASSPLGLPPGLNALWKDGGIQYAPPIR